MGRIKDLSSALPTETDAFVFDGSNGTKKLTYSNLKQVLIDDVSDDIEEEIRQIYVIDNELDESSAHAVANSAVARAVNANSSAIDSLSDIMSSMQTSQNNLSGRVDDLDEDVDNLKDSVVSPYETKQTSGGVASFKNGAGDIPLKSLVVSIEAQQSGSGNPSPTNVRAINGFTKANITRCGKNLLKNNATPQTLSGITYSRNSDYSITTNGTATAANGLNIAINVPLAPGSYILSGCPSGGAIGRYGLAIVINGTAYYDLGTGLSFTINQGDIINRVRIVIYNGTSMSNTVWYPMIRPASDMDATYEQYADYTYTVSFGSAGTVYGGTLDVTTGILTVTHFGFNPTSWTTNSSNAYSVSVFTTYPSTFGLLESVLGLTCSVASAKYLNSGNIATYGTICYGTTSNRNIVIASDINTYATPDALKQALLALDVTIVGALATPVIYQLTPTQVESILGQNNIWSDTGSVIECEYRRDLQEQLLSMLVTENASENTASFDDGADDVPVKDLVVNITPVQSGTGDPSPTNVRTISGFTEANIIRSSKNMAGGFRTGYTVNITTGEVTTAGSSDWVSNRIKVGGKPFALTVFDKGNMTNGSINIARYRADGSFYDRTNIGYFSSAIPFTRLYNAEVVDSIIIYGYQSGGASAITTAQFQVEFGTAATEYEPYNGDTYNVSFGSAGTVYKGQLDPISGMLTVTHVMADLGNLNWIVSETTSGRYNAPVTGLQVAANRSLTIICSCYKPNVGGGAFDDKTIYNVGAQLYIVDTSYINDLANFKASLAGQIAVYPLANPISYQLTPIEVRTLLANNNIWSDTGSVEICEYRADTSLVISKLINAIVSLGGNV